MGTSIPIIILFLFLWFLSSTIFSLCNIADPAICNSKEKQALLSFKQGLKDPRNQLSSWSTQEDCCRWTGVRCDNKTGRVTQLLLNYMFSGEISPSLLKLEFLNYLDLSHNNFNFTRIPSFLGSMGSLKHLDLSESAFGGLIPHQLGNLSNLHYLNLGFNHLNVDNVHWISRLSSLEYLDISGVDLHKEADCYREIGMVPSLTELYLSDCQLHNMIPSLGFVNFTSLTALDLSLNLFNCEIPESLGQLKYLRYLFLYFNSFHGPIPASLGNLSSLRTLSLGDNQLSGSLPKSIGLLSNLVVLGIANNSLTGIVSEVNFANLSKLINLKMSSTSLFFSVKSNWVPPFQLEYIEMNSVKIGPKFPAWLRTQRSIKYLSFSNSGISDTIPDWFWNMASHIEFIDFSNNQIHGNISHVLLNSTVVDLSSNCFKGHLPHLSTNVQALVIARNSFFGPVSSLLCKKKNGKNNLYVLDVSNNFLSGELSNCWMHWQSLTHLNLGSNNLSGKIPNSIGSLFALQSLHLDNNHFFGDIPSSLKNCTYLGLIDFGVNDLLGAIPSWIGEWTSLAVLKLRSNRFSGNIPPQICQLSSLQVLDLANNSLSGPISKCLNNFSAMTTMDSTASDRYYEALEYSLPYVESRSEKLTLVTKGSELEYQNILKFVRSIDLSSNNLSGSIPTEISSLFGLHFLNLSHNYLMGKIPQKIGGMRNLESLDLSRNNLSGEIPQSMSSLTFLSVLNLSYNFFSGRIPLSTQLQSFTALSYIGNVELCGAPLLNNCTEEEKPNGTTPIHGKGEDSEMKWFYIGMASGFATSFWGVCGALLLNRSWRHAYFRFLDNIYNKAYVVAALKMNWLCQKFRRHHDGN